MPRALGIKILSGYALCGFVAGFLASVLIGRSLDGDHLYHGITRLPRNYNYQSLHYPSARHIDQFARRLTQEHVGKTIVVILPDSGERYLTSVLFEGIV